MNQTKKVCRKCLKEKGCAESSISVNNCENFEPKPGVERKILDLELEIFRKNWERETRTEKWFGPILRSPKTQVYGLGSYFRKVERPRDLDIALIFDREAYNPILFKPDFAS